MKHENCFLIRMVSVVMLLTCCFLSEVYPQVSVWDGAIADEFGAGNGSIDYPYEIVKKEDLHSRPPRIPYNTGRIRYRHYGKTLERMILKANEFDEGQEKTYLIKLLANQMKKSFLNWNKEAVDDRKIFKDLDELSEGKIVLDEEQHKLTESRDILSRKNTNKNYTRKGR